MRIVFLLCEGPHDVAFLSKLLCADGYEKYSKKLCEYPHPLDKWFTKISKNLRVEDLNLENLTQDLKTVLPSKAMVNKDRDHLILLYSMNGDQQKDKRGKIISELKSWTRSPADEKEFSLMEESSEAGNNYGLILLFDADEYGVASRIEKAKEELSAHFPAADKISSNGEIATLNENLKIGVYIFADPDEGTGTLENIILPIMKQGNECVFDDAEKFLNKHYNETHLEQLIFTIDPKIGVTEKRKRAHRYYPIKSLMGVVGQLQYSGASNTVCIEKSDYISLEKINNSPVCQDILEMFSKL